MKYAILANSILSIHLVIVAIMLFGWMFTSVSYLYLLTLVTTLLFELALGYCPLTKWEFNLRKKLEPNLSYDYSFLSYYGYRLFQHRVSYKFIRYSALTFLVLSIVFCLIRFLI